MRVRFSCLITLTSSESSLARSQHVSSESPIKSVTATSGIEAH